VSLGYLLGLHELGLLKTTRYIAGVSGGAWATAAYSYVDPTAGAHVAQNDTALRATGGKVIDTFGSRFCIE
jgi:hypothetical protein